LLVEDNSVNQQVAVEVLGSLGLAPDVVGNGREAVAAVQKRAYDLVFMDVQMPVMDGYDATRAIRALALSPQPTIIAMTAHAMSGDREQCLAAGMNDYVSKPIERDVLSRLLRAWAEGRPAQPEPPGQELPAALPGLDLADCLRRLKGKRGLLLRILRGFAAHFGQAGAKLEQALAVQDLKAACDQSQTLASAALSISAQRLAKAAETFHDALSQGQQEKVDCCLTELRAALAEVSTSIETLVAQD